MCNWRFHVPLMVSRYMGYNFKRTLLIFYYILLIPYSITRLTYSIMRSYDWSIKKNAYVYQFVLEKIAQLIFYL